MKLSYKLTIAFLLVSLLAMGLVVLFLWLRIAHEFNRYLAERRQNEFVSVVTTYYQNNQSWAGVDAALRKAGLLPPFTETNAPPQPYLLVDTTREILVASASARIGERVKKGDMERGVAIKINGQTVGAVIETGHPLLRRPLDQKYVNQIQRAFAPTDDEVAAAQNALVSAQQALADLLDGASTDQLTALSADLRNSEIARQAAQRNYDRIAWRSDIGMTSEAAALQNATIAYVFYQALQSDAIQSAAERNAIFKPIEATMTPIQMTAIAELLLTGADLTGWATAKNIALPPDAAGRAGGGGQGRQGQGQGRFADLSEEERTKLRAELQTLAPEERRARLRALGIAVPEGEGQGQGGQGGQGGRFNLLVEPMINLLTARSTQ